MSRDGKTNTGPPVWIGLCSCGELTGLLVIGQRQPKPDNVRPGHRGHKTRVVRLLEHADDALSSTTRELLQRAIEVRP